jgi:hypothetical protein
MSDEDEFVLVTINETFIYKIPPRTSAEGHKCVGLNACPRQCHRYAAYMDSKGCRPWLSTCTL